MARIFFCIVFKKFHLLAMILIVVSVYSQDLEPRVYANVPKNLNVAAVGYLFTSGNVLTDPSLPITDFTLHSHNVAVNYIRTFELYNKLARVQVSLHTFMDGSQNRTNGDVLTDPELVLRIPRFALELI